MHAAFNHIDTVVGGFTCHSYISHAYTVDTDETRMKSGIVWHYITTIGNTMHIPCPVIMIYLPLPQSMQEVVKL